MARPASLAPGAPARLAAALALAALVIPLAAPPPAFAQASRCRVSDPTGTPLNIRDTPGGQVTGRIRNGVLVAVEDQQTDARGRPWALIRSRESGDIYGWVFREFIACF